jgi:hypothetical protein
LYEIFTRVPAACTRGGGSSHAHPDDDGASINDQRPVDLLQLPFDRVTPSDYRESLPTYVGAPTGAALRRLVNMTIHGADHEHLELEVRYADHERSELEVRYALPPDVRLHRTTSSYRGQLDEELKVLPTFTINATSQAFCPNGLCMIHALEPAFDLSGFPDASVTTIVMFDSGRRK